MFREQRGAVTYMTAVVMLLICTLVTFYTMRNTVLETHLSANGLQAERVMAVARAGLAEGLGRLADVPPLLPKAFSGSVPGQGDYRVRYAWRHKSAPEVLDVISEGRSADADGSVRVVAESAIFVPWLVDPPPVPVISRGAVRIEGGVVLQNEEPGALLIWSGGRAITPAGIRPRIVDRDSILHGLGGAAWIETAFSRHPAQVRGLARRIDCRVCDLSKVDQPAPMLMIQGRGGRPVALWTSEPDHAAAGPAIIFVDGDLEIARQFVFRGMLFVTGSVVIDHSEAVLRGLLIAGGDVTLREGRVVYPPRQIDVLRRTGTFMPLPGSWRERFAPG